MAPLLVTLATAALALVAVPTASAQPPGASSLRPTSATGGAGASPHPSSYPANIEYDPSGYGTYNHDALANPNIGAVDVNLNWYRVEPEPGVFDFGPADLEVAAWAKAGKRVTLELRFQHETNAPTATCSSDGWLPGWVAAKVPVLCEQIDKGSFVIPDYFTAGFEADWRGYVAAVAAHFQRSLYKDDVTYARVALGLGAEAFPLEPCYSPGHQGCSAAAYAANVAKLEAWGYTGASWLRWQESMLATYRRDFAYTTVIYPINQMLYPTSSPLNLNPATGHPIEMDVAYWAAAHGMGIGQQGLQGLYTADYADFNEIVAYVHQHYPNAYIQFQTVAELSNKSARGCSAACLVERDVQAAEHYHARSVEWYATDDSNPSFQPSLAEWERYVNK